jgi:nitrate reductase NapAB chaperone NapD
LSSNLERWGDYSGSQRKYNNPGEVWMSGYYGYSYSTSYPNAHGAWLAQIGIDATTIVGIKTIDKPNHTPALVFPNPAQDVFNIELNLSQIEYVNFELYDAQGKLVTILLRDWIKVLQNTFQFSLRDVSSGIYYVKISGNKGTNITKKIIKN